MNDSKRLKSLQSSVKTESNEATTSAGLEIIIPQWTEKPQTINQSIASLINNELFSDVSFIVEGQRIFGHKLLFALCSEVFRKMFFDSELKETMQEIEIHDLTACGFLNMVSFIYTRKIQIAPHELRATFEAADKYLVESMLLKLPKHILDTINPSNCFIILSEMTKIEERLSSQNLPKDDVINFIIHSSDALMNESFVQSDFDTLVSILKLDGLIISEIDLLKQLLKWVDTHSLLSDKRVVFSSLKHFIRFSDLNVLDFGEIENLQEYLTADEISNIYFHLCNKTRPLAIDYRSPRKGKFTVRTAVANQNHTNFINSSTEQLTVNREVMVVSIAIFRSTSVQSLFYGVYQIASNAIRRTPLVTYRSIDVAKTQGLIVFEKPLILKPNTKYEFDFDFDVSYDANTICINQSTDKSLKDDQVVFEFTSKAHCIQKINFTPL